MWKRGFFLCFLLGSGILPGAGIPVRESDVSGKMIPYHEVRIIAAPRNQVAEFAAEEAYRLLTRAGLKAEKGRSAAAGKLNLVLGKHPDFPLSQQSLDGIPEGGFRITKEADILCIRGEDTPGKGPFRDTSAMSYGYSKGTLYGLYEFLERYAGIRFYFPGKLGTIVPKKNLVLPEKIRILDYPEWEERSYLPWIKTGGSWPSCVQEYPENPNLVLLNTLRLRANTVSTNLSNALQTGDYLNRFRKTHPEYFAMTGDGRRVPEVRQKDFRCQLCLRSGIEEEIFRDIKAYFEGKSASSRGMKQWGSMFSPRGVNLTHDDAFVWCQCPVCRKIAPADKIYTDPAVRKQVSTEVWKFTCRIARRLKAEKVPNGRITMLAYTPYDVVPDCEIPDNVTVIIVLFPGIQSDCPKLRRNDAVLKAWREKCRGPVQLRAWPGKYMNRRFPGIPAMHHNLLIEYFDRRRGWFNGGFIDEGSDRQLFRHLNLYLFFKYAWNPQTDLKKILDEYYVLMFGRGAPYVRRFYDEMERIWEHELIKGSIDDALGGNSIVAGYGEVWMKIFNRGRIRKYDSWFDAAEKAAAGDPGSFGRIKLIREEIYGPLRRKQQEFSRAGEARDAWKIRPGETVWLRPAKSDVAEVETRVRVNETPESFQIVFYCGEPAMDRILAQVTGRDSQAWRDSDIEIFFNPSGDRRHYLQWCVNPNGALDDLSTSEGYKFQSGAAVEVVRGANFWKGTLTVPKKALGSYRKEGFPVFFGRCRQLRGSAPKERNYCWSFEANPAVFHEPELWGVLDLSGRPDPNLIPCGNFRGLSDRRLNTGDHLVTFRAKEAQEIRFDPSCYVSGGQSLRFDCREPKYMDFQFVLKGLKPNTRYRLSFFCRTENVKGGLSACIYGAGPGIRPMKDSRETGSVPWHRRSFIITTSDRIAKKPVLVFACNGTTGRMWVDEVRLEPLKE